MKLRMIAAAGTALCVLAGPALAGDGWYVGLGAGWDRPDGLFHYSNATVSGEAPYEGTWIGVGSVGYKFDNWRLEVEGSGSHDKFNSPYGGGTIWTGASANLLYDIPVTDVWNVYVGGGLGAGDINREIYLPKYYVTQFAQWGFQWQGIGGISYQATPNFDFFVEGRYRKLATGDATLYPANVPIGTSNQSDYVALVGFRWYPWAAEEMAPPPPPPAPPPPPPPPAPPPPVTTFIVFFDFDKSDLTAEAEQVVTQAVKTAQANGFVKVLVTGHTDTVGSDSYNQALSVRRAESVKDEMVRQGMDGTTISIEGKSFHDPLVPTGPGVREPQNRRAVIDLGGGS